MKKTREKERNERGGSYVFAKRHEKVDGFAVLVQDENGYEEKHRHHQKQRIVGLKEKGTQRKQCKNGWCSRLSRKRSTLEDRLFPVSATRRQLAPNCKHSIDRARFRIKPLTRSNSSFRNSSPSAEGP
jgi:hypothetical protein